MIKGLIMWTDEEIVRIIAEYDEYERELDAAIAAKMTQCKIGRGWYQLSSQAEGLYSNIRKGFDYNGERLGQWYADIHYTGTGRLKQYAGIWPTLKEAKREVVRNIIPRKELPQLPQMKPRK